MSDIKKIKPQNPEGTRDFLPNEVAKRNYIFKVIRDVLANYGFEEIETPAVERLETLEGKYGEEGQRQIFKIRSNRNLRDGIAKDKLEQYDALFASQFVPNKSDKGLRFDLTVPLARYVVQHQNDIVFPFKRFHVAPVWRGEKPQKGRYQEFYQFDADVIGSTSLINEVELTQIFATVFAALNMNVKIRVNSRKILEALAEYADAKNWLIEITTVIDKMDKIGTDGVKVELEKLELKEGQIEKILQVLSAKSTAELEATIGNTENGRKGIEEVNYVIATSNSNNVVFDVTLARGLNYYTGIIWEVNSNDVQMGSISSGGRYDNLTEMFGGQNMSGVGISFGIERIFDVMEELNLWPQNVSKGVKVLFVPRESAVEDFTFEKVQEVRKSGVSAEIFLGNVKKMKHFDYVESKGIAYIVEVGGNEVESGKFKLRNATTKETKDNLSIDDIIKELK